MRHRHSCLRLGLVFLAGGCWGGDLIDPDGPGTTNPPGGITPSLALRIGDTGFDQVADLAADPDGGVYVAGTFNGSVDFDPGTGTTPLTSLGLSDVFLAKYSATGALIWVGRIGGTAADTVTALARDGAGNLIVAGSFEGDADFDPGAAVQFLTSVGGTDGFVAAYSPVGGLIWARRFGGIAADIVLDVAADAAGNSYAAGVFSGQADPLPAGGGVIVSNGAATDGFLLSFTSAGAVRWAFPVGGIADDLATAVTLTSDGSVVMGGVFRGFADFASGAAGSQLTAVGGTDAFVASYTSAGAIRWARAMSGTSDEDVLAGGLTADALGGVAVSGSFAGTTVFSTGPAGQSRTSLGPSDWYAARFDASGGLQSVFAVGGTGPDLAPRLSYDLDGNLLTTGSFTGSVDFDPGASLRVLTGLATAGSDAFAARYAPSGGLLWAGAFSESTVGPGQETAGTVIIPGTLGTVLVGGRFFGSPNFGSSAAPFAMTSLGSADGFVLRLTSSGTIATSP